MRNVNYVQVVLALCTMNSLLFFLCARAAGQSTPAASRVVVPSAYVALSDTSTGLAEGRNLDISAGLVFAHPVHHLLTALELRGTYPIINGSVVGEKHFEAGMRVQSQFQRFSPYVDVLIGRGELSFQGAGYPIPAQKVIVLESFTTLYSAGFGFETGTAKPYGVVVDFQAQSAEVPFGSGSALRGTLRPSVGMVGLVYRFDTKLK